MKMTLSNTLWFLACCSFLVVVVNADICSEALADPFAALKTSFLLWTRRNPNIFQPLLIGNSIALSLSNYNPSNPTRIYAHGWTENGQNDLSLRLRDSFLQREDCNFIAVDWSLLALPPAYPKSAANVRPVGILTGNLVDFLISQGADRLQFHLMGFSLGAHVVGRAGSTSANNVIPRITGFDPAFPCFEKAGADQILERSDAEFVDIIHSNAGLLIQKRLGFPFSIGHADFWPNGGSIQPGCGTVNPTPPATITNIATIFAEAVACNHRRAVEYFIESVNGAVPFTATQCNSYAEFNTGACANNFRTSMGLPVSTTATGNFYLNTNPSPPFAQG